MRYVLVGNAKVDTWVEFKPSYYMGKVLCAQFVHRDSEGAVEYIKEMYKDISGGSYE